MKTRTDLALDAIRAVHTDRSVDLQETKSRLEELRDECDLLIEAVEADINRDNED